ncbi:MAG: hypothetical protein WC905_03845 [Patescibacteria group bacterium]|jgi:hypothetical protein
MGKNLYFDERLHAAYTSKDLREIARLAEKADTSEKGRRALDTLEATIQEVTAEDRALNESTTKIMKLAKVVKDIAFIVESYSCPSDTVNWLKAKNAIVEARIISASLLVLNFGRNDSEREKIMAQLVPISDLHPELWERIKNTFQLWVCLRDGGLRNF